MLFAEETIDEIINDNTAWFALLQWVNFSNREYIYGFELKCPGEIIDNIQHKMTVYLFGRDRQDNFTSFYGYGHGTTFPEATRRALRQIIDGCCVIRLQ